MYDLKPLSSSVAKITAETCSRKFVALGRILTQWCDVVGVEMAAKTHPLKITYRKPKSKHEKPQASLDVAATSSDAAILHYQKELLIERINCIFGNSWITSIRFVHLAGNSNIESTEIQDRIDYLRRQKLAAISLTDTNKTLLNEHLKNCNDPDLRSLLEKLGESVLKKKQLNDSVQPHSKVL